MKQTEEELSAIIKKSIEGYQAMTDYQLRKSLIGLGFNIAMFCRRHFEPGTENYKNLFTQIEKELEPIKKRAYSGLNKYSIEVEYKQKGNPVIFGYGCTEEERTEEEAMQRVKERVFKNLHTNRTIKPIFTKFEVKLIS
jgi:hypothetical protein